MGRKCDCCGKPLDYEVTYHPTFELAGVDGWYCRSCATVLVPDFVLMCDTATASRLVDRLAGGQDGTSEGC